MAIGDDASGIFSRLSRDVGETARVLGRETSNALTQQEAWEEAQAVLTSLTEVVVAQHALLTSLAERIERLESLT